MIAVPHTRVCKRRGVYLADVAVGIVLIGAAMFTLTQTVFFLADHRGSQRQKQAAVDLLLNLSETLGIEALLLDQPESTEYKGKIKSAETLTANSLPGGKLKIEVLPVKNDDVKIVRLTVSWDAGQQRPCRELEFLRAVPQQIFNR